MCVKGDSAMEIFDLVLFGFIVYLALVVIPNICDNFVAKH